MAPCSRETAAELGGRGYVAGRDLCWDRRSAAHGDMSGEWVGTDSKMQGVFCVLG